MPTIPELKAELKILDPTAKTKWLKADLQKVVIALKKAKSNGIELKARDVPLKPPEPKVVKPKPVVDKEKELKAMKKEEKALKAKIKEAKKKKKEAEDSDSSDDELLVDLVKRNNRMKESVPLMKKSLKIEKEIKSTIAKIKADTKAKAPKPLTGKSKAKVDKLIAYTKDKAEMKKSSDKHDKFFSDLWYQNDKFGGKHPNVRMNPVQGPKTKKDTETKAKLKILKERQDDRIKDEFQKKMDASAEQALQNKRNIAEREKLEKGKKDYEDIIIEGRSKEMREEGKALRRAFTHLHRTGREANLPYYLVQAKKKDTETNEIYHRRIEGKLVKMPDFGRSDAKLETNLSSILPLDIVNHIRKMATDSSKGEHADKRQKHRKARMLFFMSLNNFEKRWRAKKLTCGGVYGDVRYKSCDEYPQDMILASDRYIASIKKMKKK